MKFSTECIAWKVLSSSANHRYLQQLIT